MFGGLTDTLITWIPAIRVQSQSNSLFFFFNDSIDSSHFDSAARKDGF